MAGANIPEIVARDGAEDLLTLERLYSQSDLYKLLDLAKWAAPALRHWVGRCEYAEQQLRDLQEARRNEETAVGAAVKAIWED